MSIKSRQFAILLLTKISKIGLSYLFTCLFVVRFCLNEVIVTLTKQNAHELCQYRLRYVVCIHASSQ